MRRAAIHTKPKNSQTWNPRDSWLTHLCLKKLKYFFFNFNPGWEPLKLYSGAIGKYRRWSNRGETSSTSYLQRKTKRRKKQKTKNNKAKRNKEKNRNEEAPSRWFARRKNSSSIKKECRARRTGSLFLSQYLTNIVLFHVSVYSLS